MPLFYCSAILFDLDGVLVDSTRSVERHWRAWAQQNRLDAEKIMAIAHGVRAVEVIKRVAPHLDAAAEVREIEAREATDRDGVRPMPGAAALLASVPEGQWGVVTSGTRHLARGNSGGARGWNEGGRNYQHLSCENSGARRCGDRETCGDSRDIEWGGEVSREHSIVAVTFRFANPTPVCPCHHGTKGCPNPSPARVRESRPRCPASPLTP
jgi:Haloacid dehalogenase-like hydrolase